MDHINHPKHYNSQPVECINITQMYMGNISNVIKYVWRCELKDTKIDNNYKYNKILVIVNGYPTSGKDTFIDFCTHYIKSIGEKSVKISSVTKVKEAASILGYTGQKTDNERNFLSELKDLSTKYFNHSFNYITKYLYIENFNVYFVMVREPDEINKLVNYYKCSDVKVLTLLVRGHTDLLVNNNADNNVLDYEYDIYIENKGSLDDFKELSICFVDNYCIKDTKIDNLQKALVCLRKEIQRMQNINIAKRYKANPELYDLPTNYKDLNLTFCENIDKILNSLYPSYTHKDLLKIEKLLIEEINNCKNE